MRSKPPSTPLPAPERPPPPDSLLAKYNAWREHQKEEAELNVPPELRRKALQQYLAARRLRWAHGQRGAWDAPESESSRI